MRLRRSEPNGDGFRRIRRGRGFSYRHVDGTPLTDGEVLARIEGLVIPPAWRKVWICPHPNGHLQAVGLDDAGRRQYLYHPEWRRARDEEKYERVLELARVLPGLRAAIAADLDTPGANRERVLAGGLRILDLGIFRTGGEEYAKENGTYGLATLQREHVRLSGDELRFRYPAKGGAEREVRLRDEQLAALVRTLRRSRTGTERLLPYRCDGGWHEVRAEEVNDRLEELTCDDFTAKDLRTWNAIVLAATAFVDHEVPASQRGRQRVRAAVMREVAEELGNTPAVARASYVDPRVVREFERGRTIRPALRRIARQRLGETETRNAVEQAVVRLLSRSP